MDRRTVAASLAFAVFFTVAPPIAQSAELGLIKRLALNITLTGIFSAWSVFVLPYCLFFGARRGIAWVWAHIISFCPLAAALSMLLNRFVNPVHAPWDNVQLFLVIMAIVAFAVVLTLLILERAIAAQFATEQQPFSVWRICKLTKTDVNELLPAGHSGPILRMSASNQYVYVETALGEVLVRKSLSEMVGTLPETQGLRVHRSHWIAADYIRALRFENGNPKVDTKGGGVYPISRNVVSQIKELLAQRSEI